MEMKSAVFAVAIAVLFASFCVCSSQGRAVIFMCDRNDASSVLDDHVNFFVRALQRKGMGLDLLKRF
jgi:hypothetical protein